jgi:hypothetical protein
VHLGWPCLAGSADFLLQFIYSELTLQVPDRVARACGSMEAVVVGAHTQTADSIPTISFIKEFAFIDVLQDAI